MKAMDATWVQPSSAAPETVVANAQSDALPVADWTDQGAAENTSVPQRFAQAMADQQAQLEEPMVELSPVADSALPAPTDAVSATLTLPAQVLPTSTPALEMALAAQPCLLAGPNEAAEPPAEDAAHDATGSVPLDPGAQSALAALLPWPAAVSMPPASMPPMPAGNAPQGWRADGALAAQRPSAGIAVLPAATSSIASRDGSALASGDEAAVSKEPSTGSISAETPPNNWAQALSGASATPQSASPSVARQGAEAPLALAGESQQWQQPLMQALGDRLQVQIAGRSEQAVIKLSPPMLGQIEIAVRQQPGELQVRLTASHAEVTRQLQQLSEPLRQDLVQRHSAEVTVQVSASGRESESRLGAGRDGQAQQQAQQDQQSKRQPGRALQEASERADSFAADMNRLERVV